MKLLVSAFFFLGAHGSRRLGSRASGSGRGGVSQDAGVPDVNPMCESAVSRSSTLFNDYCMNQCQECIKGGTIWDVSDCPDWKNGTCSTEGYAFDGKVIPSSSCWDVWVHGYSSPPEKASLDKTRHIVNTPAQCQLLCQKNSECVNWIWVPPQAKMLNSSEKGACYLKSQHQVEGALKQSGEFNATTVDEEVCDPRIGTTCASGSCLECENEKRCVFQSNLHLSGWRSCTFPADECTYLKPVTTLAPTTTMPATEATTTTTETTTTTGPTTTVSLEPISSTEAAADCTEEGCCDQQGVRVEVNERPKVLKLEVTN